MVCPHCDRRIPDESKKCEYCGLPIVPEEEEHPQPQKKPNILLGTLGGLLGAAVGGVILLLACRLGGLLGSIAGITIAFCTLFGYRLLGRRLDKGGIMISMALIVLVTYLVDRLDWAFRVVSWQAEQALEVGTQQLDVFTAFMLVPSLLNTGNIDFMSYLTNLAILYAFCAAGTYFTLRSLIKRRA